MLSMRVKQFQWVILVIHAFHGLAEKFVRPNLNGSKDKVDSSSPFHLDGKGDPFHHPGIAHGLGSDYIRPWRQESPVVSISSFGKAKTQEDRV